MPDSIIQAAISYIKDLFQDNAGGHDFGHSLRVYKNALAIAEQEADPKLNRRIIALAALLHDVDDSKLFDTENNANARQFLTEQQADNAEIEQICSIINSVSFSKNRGKRPETPEAKIVQDADRLDAIGAVGIARTFAFGGEHGRTLESSVQHFYDKLLLLKDELNTEAAKRIAQERHAFLLRFLEELETESPEMIPETERRKSVPEESMHIQYARVEDLPRFMEIFEVARAFMRSTGNMHQWNNQYPAAEDLLADIEKKQLYTISEDGEIHAVFALIPGDDPTYAYIENGSWLSDAPYGTIHRIASDGKIHDVFAKAVRFGMSRIPHLRVDTHEDNKVMQHVVEKSGFQRCGIIYLEDGSPRIAYEKLGNMETSEGHHSR